MLSSLSYAIPVVAFSFYGVESIAVTAYEAQFSTSLKFPSRIIAYAVFIFYLMCTIGEALTARYNAPFLPPIFGVSGINSTTPPRSSNWVVNVALASGYGNIAGFLNGCFIFSVLSTSNTALYVSSRTLYGIVNEVPSTSPLGGIMRRLSIVVRQTGVPAWALLFSTLSFIWLPFLQLKSGYALEELVEIMSFSGSTACLIVWSALCLAFIRYERWLKICESRIRESHPQYIRSSSRYKSYTFFSWLQPWVAWAGLIGCIVVFAFSSATWWSTQATFTKVAVAYAAHVILFSLYIILKIIRRKGWVYLDPDPNVLIGELDRLYWLKSDEEGEGRRANGVLVNGQVAEGQSS